MLGTTRHGFTLWFGAGAAILSVALAGCGGHSSSKKSAAATAAPATSGTTGTTAPGATTTPGATPSTPGGQPAPGTPGGSTTTPGTTPGGGTTTPGGGTTTPGGGTTTPGGGTTTPPGGGTPPSGTTDDHGNDMASATPLNMMSPVSGQIDYAGDADWFALDLSQGVDFDFVTLNLAGGMDTVLRLIDSNGTSVLAENDDHAGGPASKIERHTITATGTYYLSVVHKDASAASGSYQVNFVINTAPPPDDHGDDLASATALTLGAPTAGLIAVTQDEDFFKVDLTAGQVYDFRTVTLDDTELFLLDDQGNQLEWNDDDRVTGTTGFHSLINGWTCPADGTYYLVVIGWNWTAMPDYEVVAELAGSGGGTTTPTPDDHGNDAASATVLSLGSAATGKIEVLTDTDWFTIDLVGGQSYDLRTATQDDTQLFVYDATSTQVAHNDDAATGLHSELLGFQPAADGTYYVVVTGWNDPNLGLFSTPDYTVSIDLVGAPPPPPPPPPTGDDHGDDYTAATPLPATTAAAMAGVNGKIEVGTDVDMFAIDALAGAAYELRTDTQDNTVLTLYDTDGTTLLDFNDDEDANAGLLNSKLGFVAQVSGTYFVAIEGSNGTTADYVVLAVDVTPTAPATNATLSGSSFVDADGSGDASQGDEVVLTFSEDVGMIQAAVFPPPPIDPAMELSLLVAGDSFGQGANMAMGPNPNEVTITLGSSPVLRLSGAFDAASVAAGSASGVDVAAGTAMFTVSSGNAPDQGAIDLESSLTAGFAAGADLNEARGYHTATVLDDGRVLVVGGWSGAPDFAYTSEIYDAGTWTDAADPSLGGNNAIMAAVDPNGNAYYIGRYDHTATKLADGRVLICGGVGFESLFDAQGNPVYQELYSAFVFDPAFNEFTPTQNFMTFPRRGHYATLLPNGQVLITGGYNGSVNNGDGGTLPFAELFDPATGSFTALTGQDMLMPREGGSAHLLASGQVLHVGGQLFAATQANPTVTLYMAPADAEVYDMANGASQGAVLNQGRRWHAAAEAQGEIFVLGGDTGSDTTTTVEKFDATANAFVAVGDLDAGRSRGRAVVFGGMVLVTGA